MALVDVPVNGLIAYTTGILRMAPPEALDALGVHTKSREQLLGTRDVYFGGSGKITGTVKEKGSPNFPLRRRVCLIEEASRMLIRDTWSDALTGAYSFDNVDITRKYTVLSYDHTRVYRAVVADGQVPELMP